MLQSKSGDNAGRISDWQLYIEMKKSKPFYFALNAEERILLNKAFSSFQEDEVAIMSSALQRPEEYSRRRRFPGHSLSMIKIERHECVYMSLN